MSVKDTNTCYDGIVTKEIVADLEKRAAELTNPNKESE